MAQTCEVVQQPSNRRAIAERVEQLPRPFGVRSCKHPSPLSLSDERRLKEGVRGSPVVGARLRELQGALDVFPGGHPVAVPPMTTRAPVEDVGTKTIRRQVRPLREHERLLEEDECLANLGLGVADDSDLEHHLGSVDVGESGANGERGRFLEQPHRELELPGAYVGPGFPQTEAKREGRCDGRSRLIARASKGLQRLVVPTRLVQELRVAHRRLEPLGICPADAVFEEFAVGGQAVGQPFQGLVRRSRLSPLDLAHVFLGEAPAGELRLAQPGRATERANPLADRRRTASLRLFPVSLSHT